MEEFDLNKLRTGIKKETAEKAPETKEQQISRLQTEIAELEGKVNGPSRAEAFLAKSPDEQATVVAAANESLPEAEQYSLQDYIDELNEPVPDINELRLAVAKSKLEELLNAKEQ